MEKLTIALDWTANTNHTGFYVSEAMGLYESAGLAVSITTPEEDNYTITPAKKVELGQADFALCPFESIISYRTKAKPFKVKAIAALLKEDLSAIVVLQDSGINRPKGLDGKSYASYKARYEDEIVKQMVRNDGGNGEISLAYPEKLGIWETLLNQKHHATWVFMNWEGVEAEGKGIALRAFKMKDYGIPYGYSPVILAAEGEGMQQAAVYQAFLKATKAGFLHAQKHPEEAVSILKEFIPQKDRDIDLLKSQKMTAAHYGTEADWGIMQPEKVQTYLDWLQLYQLEPQKLLPSEVMTNELLENTGVV